MLKSLETTNYVFYFDENSLADREIAQIAQRQEAGFRYICDTLGVNFGEKICYWLCETPEDVGRIYENKYGDYAPCNGFAEEPAQVYTVYNDEVKGIGTHEDAHLISYKIGKPVSNFLREGLATFFDGTWRGVENTTWAYIIKQDKSSPSIVQLLTNEVFQETDCKISYPLAGAFTAYLLLRYGRERYSYFYMCPDLSYYLRAKVAFGKYIDEIEKDFWEYLEFMSLDKGMLESIRAMK